MAGGAGQRARELGLKVGDRVTADPYAVRARWVEDCRELGTTPCPPAGTGVVFRVLGTKVETFDVEVELTGNRGRYCYDFGDLLRGWPHE